MVMTAEHELWCGESAELLTEHRRLRTTCRLTTGPTAPPPGLWQPAAGVTPEEQERLASVATQRSIDPSRRFMMALSKVRLILKLRGKQAAQDYLNFVKQEYPEQVADQRHARVFESLAEVEKLCK